MPEITEAMFPNGEKAIFSDDAPYTACGVTIAKRSENPQWHIRVPATEDAIAMFMADHIFARHEQDPVPRFYVGYLLRHNGSIVITRYLVLFRRNGIHSGCCTFFEENDEAALEIARSMKNLGDWFDLYGPLERISSAKFEQDPAPCAQ